MFGVQFSTTYAADSAEERYCQFIRAGGGRASKDRPMNETPFQPARLRLARELNSWTQADLARHVDLTPAAVSQFESGAARPTADTLARISDELNVPEAFFHLPVQETHEGFFRSLRRTGTADRRRARAIAHIAYDVVAGNHGTKSPPSPLPSYFPSSLEASPEEIENIANRVRQDWGLPAGPVSNVVRLLEDHGIVVIRLPLNSADVDAFSLPFPDHPVVVLGSDKNDRARSRFDAAHELGHLVMHGDEVWGLPAVEKQAHMFAAAFLMPRTEIRGELPDRGDWPTLFQLKERWQVSLAALLMRAKTLGVMSESNYLTAIKAASARGWRRVEPVPLGAPEAPTRVRAILESDGGARIQAILPAPIVRGLFEAVA